MRVMGRAGRVERCRHLPNPFLAAMMLALPAPAAAADPGGFRGVPDSSAGFTVSRQANSDLITINGPTAVIDWTTRDSAPGTGTIDFLPSGRTASFEEASGHSGGFTVLNRAMPSGGTTPAIQLNGHIVSRVRDADDHLVTGGHVWFYSPGGVLVGAGARFDVGSLTISNGLFDIVVATRSDRAASLAGSMARPGSSNEAIALALTSGAGLDYDVANGAMQAGTGPVVLLRDDPTITRPATTEATRIVSSIQSLLSGARIAGGSIGGGMGPGGLALGQALQGRALGTDGARDANPAGIAQAAANRQGGEGPLRTRAEGPADEGGDDEGGGGVRGAGARPGAASVGNANRLIDTSNLESTGQPIDTPVTGNGNSALWGSEEGVGEGPGGTP